MKIFELQAGQLGQQLDQQLQGVADGVDVNNNQPDPTQAPPEQPDLNSEEDEPEDPPKKVDPYLVAQVKGLPYVTDYEWDDTEKVSPYSLLQKSYGDLVKVRNLVRTKINMKTLSDQVGTYDDPTMMFYQDMMSFIEKVMSFKKKSDQGGPADRPIVANREPDEDDAE